MDIKKVIHWGVGQGEWGNSLNFFLEVLLQYLLGYTSMLLISKQYPHFYAFYWFLMCN